jgi:hypothetical protein
MKIIKSIAGIAFALLLIVFITKLNYARSIFMAGDTAGYIDLLKRIYLFNDMRSDVFAAAYPIFDLNHSVDGICKNPLINTYEQNSFFRWHSYAIAFPIAWLGGIFTSDFALVAAVINAINVVAIFLTVILIANNEKFNKFEIILLCILLLSFTPLIGAISGQYYFDRFFISFALYYCYLQSKKNASDNWFFTFLVIFSASLISERSALMMGFLVIYLSIFTKINNKAYRYSSLVMGFTLVGYYIIWSIFFQQSIYIGSTNPLQILSNLRLIFDWNTQISEMTRQWLLILFPMLLLTFISGKYLPLVLIFLLPNLLVTVGGAEKIGYVTHYHSYYIPLVIFSAIKGYSVLKFKFNRNQISCGVLIVIILFNYFNIKNRLFVVGPALTHSLSGDFSLLISGSEYEQFANKRKKDLNELISLMEDNNSKISVSEFIMPQLVYRGYTRIRLLPIGIYDSDYVIVESDVKGNGSDINLQLYSDVEETKKIGICLYSIIESGFHEVGRKEISGVRYRLLKAKKYEKN